MAIKILRKGLPRLGVVKIGGLDYDNPKKTPAGKVWYPPKKYDHFKIFTTERDGKDRPVLDAELMEALGGKPTELDIVFPFDDPDLCFRTELAYYKGSTRFCHGDGETATRLKLLQADKYGAPEPFGPCGEACPDFQSRRCKPSGVLSFLLKQQPFVGGVYEARTHGWRSVANLTESISAVRMATGGLLAWIPLKLSVTVETVQPKDGGAAQLAPIMKLYYPGSPMQLIEEKKKLLELQAPLHAEIKRLEAGLSNVPDADPDPEEAAAIVAEFYTDGKDGPAATPTSNGGDGFLDTAGTDAPEAEATQDPKPVETRKASTRRAAQKSAAPKAAPSQPEPPPIGEEDLF